MGCCLLVILLCTKPTASAKFYLAVDMDAVFDSWPDAAEGSDAVSKPQETSGSGWLTLPTSINAGLKLVILYSDQQSRQDHLLPQLQVLHST